MTEVGVEDARRIWRERKFPIVLKPISGKLNVRFPIDYLTWPLELRAGEHLPVLIAKKKCWEVPRARFDRLIAEALESWGKLHVIQYFVDQKRCALRCRQATGYDCECACDGEYHGVEGPPGKWIDITETFSVASGDHYLSWRLLTKRTKF